MKRIFTLIAGSLIAMTAMGQEWENRGSHNDPRHVGHEDPRHMGFYQGKEGFPKAASYMMKQTPMMKQVPQDRLKATLDMQVLDSLVEYWWDENASGFREDYKVYYTYNEDGQIVEYRSMVWNSTTGSWEQDDLETYEYDEKGNLLVYMDYDLNDAGTEWFSGWKREYVYEEGRLSGYFEFQKRDPGEEFYAVWAAEFTYDGEGRRTGSVEYLFVFSWEESYKTEYDYDEDGNLLQYHAYVDSDTDPSGWIYTYREDYTYDRNGYVTLYEAYDWDEDEETWVNDDREEYTYATNGNLEDYLDYNWDEAAEQWVLSWKREHAYDNNYSYDQLVLPWFYHDDFPNFFNHMMIEYHTYDYVEGEWENDYKGNHHFSGTGTTGVKSKESDPVSFYPNPAGSVITLQVDGQSSAFRLEVFDLTGKNVYSDLVENRGTVDISRLSEGFYLFRISDTEGKHIGAEKIYIRE